MVYKIKPYTRRVAICTGRDDPQPHTAIVYFNRHKSRPKANRRENQ